MNKPKKQAIRFTGQHFTIDKKLIHEMIQLAQVSENDTVLDIGAGKGAFTVPLSSIAKHVIAVEKDKGLANYLNCRFSSINNVFIYANDFKDFTIPKSKFKVVASIPYSITSHIFKTLMYSSVDYFEGGSIIMQLEPAQKLTRVFSYNPYSVYYQILYEMKVVREISPYSFMPPPTINSALLFIRKRKKVLIDIEKRELFIAFVSIMLYNPNLCILTALKKFFRKNQIRDLVHNYGINTREAVVQLNTVQWCACFNEMIRIVPMKYHPKIGS